MCLYQEILEEILEVTLLRDLGGKLLDEVSGSSAGYDHHLGSTDQSERARERLRMCRKQSLK